MTRQELTVNIAELLQDLQPVIHTEVDRLIKSGALPLDDEPADSAALGKCVLTVALENIADLYRPRDYDKKRQKIVKNLRRF